MPICKLSRLSRLSRDKLMRRLSRKKLMRFLMQSGEKIPSSCNCEFCHRALSRKAKVINIRFKTRESPFLYLTLNKVNQRPLTKE